MRIAYVALNLNQRLMLGGVGRKLRQHTAIWREKGHDARLFVLSPDDIELPDVTSFKMGSKEKIGPLSFLSSIIARVSALKALIESVRAYSPDMIYLRQSLYFFPLHKIAQIAPIVMEINTDDVQEYKLRNKLIYLYHRLTRQILLRRVTGFVTISHEIANLPTITKFDKPVIVIPNGIDLNSLKAVPAPTNPNPRIAFAGNPGPSWNGIDKLLWLAQKTPQIQIDMIGYTREDLETFDVVPENVICHGFMPVDQVYEILQNADVACGTLALHRKKLDENSALKIREALALGLPIILAYFDTDISEHNFDFVLQLTNTENNVHENLDRIRDFVFQMVGKRADRDRIAPLIDQRAKEEQRLAFLRQFYQPK